MNPAIRVCIINVLPLLLWYSQKYDPYVRSAVMRLLCWPHDLCIWPHGSAFDTLAIYHSTLYFIAWPESSCFVHRQFIRKLIWHEFVQLVLFKDAWHFYPYVTILYVFVVLDHTFCTLTLYSSHPVKYIDQYMCITNPMDRTIKLPSRQA